MNIFERSNQNGFLSRNDATQLMVELIGVDQDEAKYDVNVRNMAHAMVRYFGRRLQAVTTTKNEGDEEDMQLSRDQVIWIYLLYLVDIIFFTNKRIHYLDMKHLNYFYNLKMVRDFARGTTSLTNLFT